MKPSLAQASITKRRRIPYSQQNSVTDGFSEIPLHSQLHDLQQEISILEERIVKLVAQSEAYHLLVQKHYSGKLRLQNKITGVLRHVNDTLSQSTIPGGRVRIPQQLDPEALAQDNKVLRWKLAIIEKFIRNSFPEFEQEEVDIDLTCSGTPVKKSTRIDS